MGQVHTTITSYIDVLETLTKDVHTTMSMMHTTEDVFVYLILVQLVIDTLTDTEVVFM